MPAIRHLHMWPLPATQPWLATPECHCPSWYLESKRWLLYNMRYQDQNTKDCLLPRVILYF